MSPTKNALELQWETHHLMHLMQSSTSREVRNWVYEVNEARRLINSFKSSNTLLKRRLWKKNNNNINLCYKRGSQSEKQMNYPQQICGLRCLTAAPSATFRINSHPSRAPDCVPNNSLLTTTVPYLEYGIMGFYSLRSALCPIRSRFRIETRPIMPKRD